MSVKLEYHLLFPKTHILFTENDLTFSINQIRSRKPSVLYVQLHFFDMDGELIDTLVSDRWVIGTVYEHRECKFTIDDSLIQQTTYTQIEMVLMGIDSENPLYFTEVMLQQGDFEHYHKPSDLITNLPVKLINNMYANLIKDDGDYLQVIRPKMEDFTTTTLTGAEYTILAPHFADDEDFDDDVAVFMELLNQREQTIDVLR